MPPFFSIIVPTYNRAHMLPKAIESVITQTFSDWELLIVDDGSKDNTKEVTESYHDSRIRYIYQQNKERSAARNNGIEHARGEYICFLDSDDYYLKPYLAMLHEKIAGTTNIAAYYVGIFNGSESELAPRDEVKINGIRQFDKLVSAYIHCQQICVHHSILKRHKFNTSFRFGEDLDLWIRINDEYPFVYLENQFNVVIIDHEDRSTRLKNTTGEKEYLATIKHIISKKHPGRSISKNVKRLMRANAYFYLFRHYLYREIRFRAMANMFLSIISNPRDAKVKFKINIFLKLCFFSSFQKILSMME